jgi:hypothetical protein
VQPAAGAALAVSAARRLSNGVIQRLLVQRSPTGPTELDDALAARINRARSSGRALDATVQTQLGDKLQADFGQVRVHTGEEAHALNEQLSARAFTTGQDIFFRAGEYNPHSGSGQELIAHELTHVVQQSSGAVPSGGRMTVNAPGDRFEQEADAVARTIGAAPVPAQQPAGEASAPLQKQELAPPEEEDQSLQRQELLEEEEVEAG